MTGTTSHAGGAGVPGAPSDSERRRWVRSNPIPGHWMDVKAWIEASGRRQEQAICECGWQGPIRTEFEAGNRDAEDHLLVLMPRSS